LGLAVAAGLFLWVWAVVDCLTNRGLSGSNKTVWFLVTLLLPVVGALAYRSVKPGEVTEFRGAWMIASSFVTFGISTGFPYYNISFFFPYFRDNHGWTQELVTTGAPIAVLLTIWAGPFIVPRVSPRLLIIVGTGLTFLSFQWFGRLSGGEYEYYLCWCVYMFGYFLAGPIPHQIIVSNWYKERRGLAMGITYVGVGVVGAMGNRLSPWLAQQIEYTEALQYMSFLLLLAWPMAFFIVKDRPQDVGQLPDGKKSEAEVVQTKLPTPKSFGFLASKVPFWLLLVGSAASIGSIAAVNFLLQFVLEEQGFTDPAARNAVWADASSIYLISSIGGRLLAGYLADRFPRKWVMLVTYVIVAISIPLLFLITPEQPGFVYVFAICFGFALGADYMLIPLMAADQFGLASLGKAMSAILPSDTITQFWFPRIVAELRTIWGGYSYALWAVFGMAAFGAAAIALLPRHHKPVDED
jgi:MFS family permease